MKRKVRKLCERAYQGAIIFNLHGELLFSPLEVDPCLNTSENSRNGFLISPVQQPCTFVAPKYLNIIWLWDESRGGCQKVSGTWFWRSST